MIRFRKKETVKGDFEKYSDYKIYSNNGDPKMELVKHGDGVYTKTFTVKVEMAKSILAKFNINTTMTITEHIRLSRNTLTIRVDTPDELKELADFEEVFVCKKKGSRIAFDLHLKGKIKVNAMLKGMAENMYINERMGEIRRSIANTIPIDLGDFVIPQ